MIRCRCILKISLPLLQALQECPPLRFLCVTSIRDLFLSVFSLSANISTSRICSVSECITIDCLVYKILAGALNYETPQNYLSSFVEKYNPEHIFSFSTYSKDKNMRVS